MATVHRMPRVATFHGQYKSLKMDLYVNEGVLMYALDI